MNITDIVNALTPIEGISISDVLIPEDCCLVCLKFPTGGWAEFQVNVVDENTVHVTCLENEDAEPEQFHSIDGVISHLQSLIS